MRVCCVNYYCDEADPDRLLLRYGTLVGWAEGLRTAGAGVCVVQRFHDDLRLERNRVEYLFIRDVPRIGPASGASFVSTPEPASILGGIGGLALIASIARRRRALLV